jgi:hypothetical protein
MFQKDVLEIRAEIQHVDLYKKEGRLPYTVTCDRQDKLQVNRLLIAFIDSTFGINDLL